jgi:YfiH family protein
MSAAPQLVLPRFLSRDGRIRAAVSTRKGGFSRAPFGMNLSFRVGDREEDVRRNRELFLGALGISTNELAMPGQIHSDRVQRVDVPGHYPDCDALLTATPRVFLAISVADCVPILLYDPGVSAVAAVHAGWRGTASGILPRAMERLESEFGTSPSRLLAYLGPSASRCCYTVGEDVASQFDSRVVLRHDGRIIVDLKEANLAELLKSGVPREQIEVSPSCTICEPLVFHSFRRDGANSGRMMAVIGVSR